MISYSVIIFSILERNGEVNGLNKKLDKCIKEKDLSSQFNLSFCVNFHFSLNF
ncbi:unknown [Clostridium sp. CAG:169]|nr:unknown [Clostridium sp. CAG:169]